MRDIHLNKLLNFLLICYAASLGLPPITLPSGHSLAATIALPALGLIVFHGLKQTFITKSFRLDITATIVCASLFIFWLWCFSIGYWKFSDQFHGERIKVFFNTTIAANLALFCTLLFIFNRREKVTSLVIKSFSYSVILMAWISGVYFAIFIAEIESMAITQSRTVYQ